MITPSQIKEKVISTASHGYDIDETNAFIAEIEEAFSAVYNENKELYRKMEILASKVEEYRAEEDTIKEALLTAQKAASDLTKQAQKKADELLSESAQTVQNTVLDAKEKAEKIISEAREYSASLTKEKTDSANAILNEAQERADKEIGNAKADASALLDEAKKISSELITKAKQEKEYYDSLTAELKAKSEAFKAQLVMLYEAQLDGLEKMMDLPGGDSNAEYEEKIENTERAIDDISAKIEETRAEIEEPEEEEASAEEASEEPEEDSDFEEITEDEEEPEEEPDEEKIEYELEEVSDEAECEEEPAEEEHSEADVHSAINAFSQDTVTPVEEQAVPEISEEPEMEESANDGQLPFESFFNVKSEVVRTDEKISLIPPDEDDDDDDDLKFHGFFKKKRK